MRALGILCLLAAEPLLDAAFLRPEMSRLLVTVFAYLLIVVGLALGDDAVSAARSDCLERAKRRRAGGCVSALGVDLRARDPRLRGRRLLSSPR